MRSRPVVDFPRSEAGLVDKFIGSAFDVVYTLYKNLDEILLVDENAAAAKASELAAKASEEAAKASELAAASSAAAAAGNTEQSAALLVQAQDARDASESFAIQGLAYLEQSQAAVITTNQNMLDAQAAADDAVAAAAQVGPIRADLLTDNDVAKGAALLAWDGDLLSNQLNLSKKLASYAALRAYNGPATRFELTGYGISGSFVQVPNPNNILTDDGAIFIVGAGGRTYQRENSYPIQARWFGLGLGAVTNNVALSNASRVASNLGAGVVDTGGGQFSFDNTPLTLYSNIRIRGSGKKATTFNVAPAANGIFADFVLATGSYNEGGITDLTINNSGGVIGGSAIRTPQDTAGFNNAQKWNFDGMGFQGNGWSKYMDIGDCAQGTARNIELRGKYNPALTDTGQDDCIGINLSGLKGNVRMTIDAFAMLGIRRGLVLGECAEGFVLTNGEITSTWIGVSGNQVAAKPGGFIDNVHISCNKGGIQLSNRRDMTMGTVQIYRSNGMFDHGTDWNAYNLSNCQRITLPSLLVRVFPGVFTGNNIAVAMAGASDKCYVEDLTLSEVGGVTRAVNINGTTNCGVDEISCEGVTQWVYLDGVTSNFHCDKINAPDMPASPFYIGPSVDRSTCRLPKVSSVKDYNEVTYSADTTVSWKPRQNSRHQKISMTGAGPYTVTVNLDWPMALVEDFFDVHLVNTNTVKTIVFVDTRSGNPVTLLTITGTTAANILRNIIFRFNGAGWVIHRNSDSLN